MSITQEFSNETTLSKEIRNGFSEYSKYVISDRALPDARDGMKPVHRRIIWAMHGLKLTYRSSHKKCARIVGEVTGKYHPHFGGTYESVVRLAQDWSLRYPLVDGQGNFGSIDGFPPAAMRYTEARLAKISQELVKNISPNVVPFVENFDGEEMEPTVLPVTIPHLLLNGTKGIAVGMSSNIPPHQLGELLDGCIAIIDNPDIPIDELMQYVTGPDFPTGATIIGGEGISNLYKTGKGSLRVRSRLHLETPETHNVRESMLIVTEIPYFVNKTTLIEEIANLINDGKLRGVLNIRDLSKDNIRIEIEIEENYADEISIKTIKAQLFKRTQLENLFHARTLAFVYGKPRTLNLKQALSIFLDHREIVVKNIAIEELEKVQSRLHILEGLIIASNHIDDVIALIRGSESRAAAHAGLKEKYELSDAQAKAVLDMTLARLAKVEQNELQGEAADRRARAQVLHNIIENRHVRLNMMKQELLKIKDEYNDERRTEIVYHDDITGLTDRQYIHERTLLLSSTSEGYVRAIDFNKFKQQRRGGRGVSGVPLVDNERLLDLLIVSNKDEVLLITEDGKIHKIPAFEIPEVYRRTSKGSKFKTVIPVESNIVKIVPVKEDEFTEDRVLVTVTREGIVKRTTLDKFSNIRKTGIKCLNLKTESDRVADAFVTDNNSYIFIASKKGSAVVFDENNARLVGRVSMGVKGMKLRAGDEVVASFAVPKADYENISILTVTEGGYGKRTALRDYRLTHRGALGVKNIKITAKNKNVVSSLPVPNEQGVTISLINSDGILIKTVVENIRIMGRNTQGVRVMRILKGQSLRLASKIIDSIQEEDLSEEANEALTALDTLHELEDLDTAESDEFDESEDDEFDELEEDEFDESEDDEFDESEDDEFDESEED